MLATGVARLVSTAGAAIAAVSRASRAMWASLGRATMS